MLHREKFKRTPNTANISDKKSWTSPCVYIRSSVQFYELKKLFKTQGSTLVNNRWFTVLIFFSKKKRGKPNNVWSKLKKELLITKKKKKHVLYKKKKVVALFQSTQFFFLNPYLELPVRVFAMTSKMLTRKTMSYKISSTCISFRN